MIALLTAVVVLGALLLGRRQLADLRTLGSPSSPSGFHRAATVSVVIPARNEGRTLPTLLGSLAALDEPVREVVVVDDGSDDGTAEVARARGARVVAAPPPPSGWTGKAWACQLGADATDGSLLLFLDADVVLAPDAVCALLARPQSVGGLVSVQPYHLVRRPYEQLSAYFNLVSLMGSGAFARRPPRRPMAFGPCLLTSRADYKHAGEHAGVRGEILDDAQLAAAYDRAGMPVRCATGGRSVRMRMYPGGLRQLVEGWTKNIASGAGQADRRSAMVTVAWVAAHFAVAVGALQASVEVAAGRAGSMGRLLLWAALWVVVAVQLRLLLRRIGSFHWMTWAVFPLPLLGFGMLFAWSVVLTHVRGSVRWRGRRVAMSDGRRPADESYHDEPRGEDGPYPDDRPRLKDA